MAVETVAPVLRSVTVRRSPEDAFRIFTEGIGDWWPLATHSMYEQESASILVEPGVGGRFVERSRSGAEAVWGEILVWEPPHRLVYTWHPGYAPDDPATEVEIQFIAAGDGVTRVEFEHRGWEALADAAEKRASYDHGWPVVLEHFVAGTAA